MSCSEFQIRQAANIISYQGVIAYPTESVYGLGCDPQSYSAVMQILALKQRPLEKGLIIIGSSLQQLKPYILTSAEEDELILKQATPMTWLVDKSSYTPYWVSGKHNSIAIRVSQHPVVVRLCESLQQPIISTSANPAGKRPAKTAFQSRVYFKNGVDAYLHGQVGPLHQPTPITHIKTMQLIRNAG